MEVDEWVDTSYVGSTFEEQTSYSGKWRHRYKEPQTDPWMEGPAPKDGTEED